MAWRGVTLVLWLAFVRCCTSSAQCSEWRFKIKAPANGYTSIKSVTEPVCLLTFMSVAIHVGQCGCQVGAAYWRLASSSPPGSSPSGSPLFHGRSGLARCVLADSEPKAVAAAVRAGLRPAHALSEHRGRGNNWAMGYHFTEGGSHLADRVLEALRRETEALDGYRGTLVTLSLGGGTGSGVGSRVLERLRDAYPRGLIVAAIVAPSAAAGDSPLQNYNAVLTLRALRATADAVIFRENDELMQTARYWRDLVARGGAASPTAEGPRVTLAEMNEVMAADLAGLTFPKDAGRGPRPFDPATLVHDLCPMPDALFLDVRTGILRWGPQRSATKSTDARAVFHCMTTKTGDANEGGLPALEAVARATAQAFPRYSFGAIASAAVVRGFSSQPARSQTDQAVTKWLDVAMPRLAWTTPVTSSRVTYSIAPLFQLTTPTGGKPQRTTASVTMCGNNGHFLPTTRILLDRARRQFKARAYVHWYQQYGLCVDSNGEQDDFSDAFDACDSIIRNYETLLR